MQIHGAELTYRPFRQMLQHMGECLGNFKYDRDSISKLFQEEQYTGPHEILSVINPVVYIAAVDGALRQVRAKKIKKESRDDDEKLPLTS